MRHVFIVNPAAGKKRGALELLPRIHAAFAGAEEGAYAIRAVSYTHLAGSWSDFRG